MYRTVITAGCSFSAGVDSWPVFLEQHLSRLHPGCEFQHFGVASQGNELIQKKATRALLSALERYRPEEIAVFVMWSTHDRKSLYLPWTTRETMNVSYWQGAGTKQFTDLQGRVTDPGHAGWYHMHGSRADNNPVTEHYYSMIHHFELGVHTTLENMLTFNLLVEKTGVACWQMLIMSAVYEQIQSQSQSELSGHLYRAIDWTRFDLRGEYDYLQSQASPRRYFQPDGWHPNRPGHGQWLRACLLPRIGP